MARINPTPSSASMYELIDFEKKLGTPVCLRAIDEALDANARTWTYVKAILRNKEANGVTSLEEWDRQEAERLNAKHKKTTQTAEGYNPDVMQAPMNFGDNEAIFAEMEEWK